ncbi:MAG TPA: FtsX-like permease family protein [Polyangiaceae bacterium]|nr:FtsX-like permease family protein [Polyangiaceae bacterium]
MVAVRNLRRNPLRTVLTIAAVMVAIIFFVTLRTVLSAWTAGADHAAKDRIGTRHKVSFIMPMPRRYVQEVRDIAGVKSVASANWFGGKDPKHDREFFATLAVEPKEFLEVYDEIELPAEQREVWFQTKTGAIIGDSLAKKLGWKIGDKITLTGTIYPGEWEFVISGIYTATRRSVDRATLYFHYDYLNDDPRTPQSIHDQVGWIVSRVDDPGRSADIAKAIDAKFDERDIQTLSMSERAMNTSFIGMISAILKAVNVVSLVMLGIMALIIGNTVAMGVRERTHEYGVLRAIGFLPQHLAVFVVSESVAVSIFGGLLGIMLAYPLVEQVLGRWLEENLGGFFPFFRIDPQTIGVSLVLAAVLGVLAGALPAYSAMKLKVVDSLRRAG